MSVITKDLGVATAYGYAKSKGYTGTEEEFAELMASYADVAQQAEAAAQDAEDAKDAAVSAKNDAQTAQAAAAGSAQTANTKATEASNSAQTAAGSATAAGNSATAASGSAQTAQTAAQTATTKASEASSSASAASTAKTGAETARTGAQTAQTAAETAQANAEAAASSVSASAAQIEQNTEDITGLKNDLSEFPNGNYPQMGAGYANQLVSGLKKEDQTPYNFRKVPYDATLEEVKKIVGGTIVNNQLVDSTSIPATKTESGVTFTNNTDGTITVNGTATADIIYVVVSQRMWDTHKYIISGCPQVGSLSTYNLAMRGAGTDCFDFGNGNIWDASGNSWKGMVIYVKSGATVTNLVFKPNFTDLTLTFGTSIADYVYSLEQATTGAGVVWLKKHFPAQFDAGYQAYDAGSMQSVSGLTVHKMVGFNQWNEQWEVGAYTASGAPSAVNDRIRSANMIPVLPNTAYYFSTGSTTYFVTKLFFDADRNPLQTTLDQYQGNSNTPFTTPNDAHFMLWYGAAAYGTTYNHDICINLHWDGEKDGTYEPYKTWSYALDDSITLRGIPKVDANGNLYYDGDEYLPDGTVNRRYGIVDLGSLSYTATIPASGNNYFTSTTVSDVKVPSSASNMANVICARYFTSSQNAWTNNIPCVFIDQNSHIVIADKSYSDASTFKTAMSGVYLVYELATPTTETALPYQETQIVDDFGTEEFVLADGAFPVPVGHNTMYQNNLRAKLEMSPDSPDGDGLYVVQQESGENTYVPLASTATIQDILARLTALENA